MPISKNALVRSTVALILLGAVALIAIVAATLWLVSQTRTYSETLARARTQRSAIVQLHILIQEAETGQRGYLLTGNSEYLEPYTNAQAKLGPQMEQVEALISSDPAERSAFDRLRTILAGKLAELKQTIDLAQTNQRDQAIAIVKSNQGRTLMEESRNLVDELVGYADRRVADSIRLQQESITALQWVTLIGALVIILVVGGSVGTVVSYTRQLGAAQDEVRALNVGLEARVQERTADLGRANEEIQRFAYIVTHDLRAPLVNIMGFTSELEASLKPIQAYVKEPETGGNGEPAPAVDAEVDPLAVEARSAAIEDLPEAIGFIRSSTRKMDGLINAILKLSREGRRTLKPERIELDSLLRISANSIQHQVEEAGGEVLIEARVPAVTSDRLALEQIFGNLFDNAVKYRSQGRPLRIRVGAEYERGHRIRVEFEDNGRGIAAQDHDRVFDLFRRSGAQDQPGEGIGLAHVRTMVRNLGGNITLRSEFGQGTTFTLSLPRDLRQVTGSQPT